MRKLCVVLLLIAVTSCALLAGTKERSVWENLNRIASGTPIEVQTSAGERIQGSFTGFTSDALRFNVDQRPRELTRTEVKRVQLRGGAHHKALWIGVAAGAAAGAGIGAAAGSALGSGSGGDFTSLRGVVIGVGAGVGALAGLAIGSLFDHQSALIYQQ